MNTFIGIVVEIGETKMWKSGFRTRHVVIDTGTSSSPNPIKVDCRDYDIEILDGCSINDVLEVTYHLQGRKYEGKFFTNVVSDSIRRVGQDQVPVQEETTYETNNGWFNQKTGKFEEGDPF